MSRLELTGVSVEPAGASRAILRDVSLTVDPGELVLVTGASGAGKTTLLEVAAGTLTATRGSVHRGGSVAMAFQSPERMFFETTVLDEVAFALRSTGSRPPDDESIRRRALAALEPLGLDASLLDRHPLTLSGGEQRLVALASVLVAEPAVLLLDEPAAGLTASRTADVVRALATLRERGTAIVVATHEIDTFVRAAGRVVAVSAGVIVADGPPGAIYAPDRLGDLTRNGIPLPVALRVRARLAGDTALPAPETSTPLPSPGAAKASRRRLPLPPTGPGMLASVLLAAIFFLPAPLPWLALLAAAIPAVAASAGVRLAWLGRMLIPVVILGTLALGAHLATTSTGEVLARPGPLTLTSDGADAGARAWLRIVAPVLIGLAFTASRPPERTARELRALLAALPVTRTFAAGTGLAVLLVARLAPLMRNEVRRIDRAQRLRGGGRPSRLRAAVSIGVPVITGTLQRAQRVAIALALRGWSLEPQRAAGVWPPTFDGAGWVVAACSIVIVTAAITW